MQRVLGWELDACGASLMWIQEKVNEKIIKVTAIPTAINCSDIGTKVLSKARLQDCST